ncbi:MAG: PGN_0703 family putative restriction endonuclease [Myxococcota bacterium]
MPEYQTDMRRHLCRYRSGKLRVKEKGLYLGRTYQARDGQKVRKSYGHILPKHRQELNILPGIREGFWKDSPRWGVKLHRDFHHLNSSQAMCFNLFYPFFGSEVSDSYAMLAQLELGDGALREWRFEYEPDPEEGTNFDFYLNLQDGREAFFEIKLTESDFGAGRIDERRSAKLRKIYRPALESLVAPEALEEDFFFKHYQLLRNVSYLSKSARSILFLVFPRENEALEEPLEKLTNELTAEARKRLRVVHLEDLVTGLAARVEEANLFLRSHLEEFSEKYFVS